MKQLNKYRWLVFVGALVGPAVFKFGTELSKHPREFLVIIVAVASFVSLILLIIGPELIDEFLHWKLVRAKRVRKAPGTRLMSVVTFLYSPVDVEKVFEPTLADWRKEYFEALAAHHRWGARWINVRYRYRFAAAMGLSKAWKLIDLVLQAFDQQSRKASDQVAA